MKVPQFKLLGFKRPREVALPALGKLEREVMDEAWRRGRALSPSTNNSQPAETACV
jgi:hypothetical protein